MEEIKDILKDAWKHGYANVDFDYELAEGKIQSIYIKMIIDWIWNKQLGTVLNKRDNT